MQIRKMFQNKEIFVQSRQYCRERDNALSILFFLFVLFKKIFHLTRLLFQISHEADHDVLKMEKKDLCGECFQCFLSFL